MTDYLALYRNYLTTEKRMSANTVSSYMRDLGQYQDWLQQKKTDIKKAKNTLLQEYIKRLEQLETITGSYPGVDKAYAIQAGREVRVMVKPEQVSEDQMVILARDLAKKIEEEMEYPGQIKVHVLRETKVVEYAK